MSWCNVWDRLKTKTCRYLLQRYLGQFFENKLNLEQLNVDLYNGRAVVQNVKLKVEALNELFEAQGWGFEIVSGHIGCLTVNVPWNAIMTNDSTLEVNDMVITLAPVKRQHHTNGTSMLESMWSSASSSMQMAAECMMQNDSDVTYEVHSNNAALVGLETFAETIDNVLNRIQAKCNNTVIKIEYSLPNVYKKISIAIKIDCIEYKNETRTAWEKTKTQKADQTNKENEIKSRENLLPTLAKHNVHLKGITMYTTEGDCFDSNFIPVLKIRECQNIQVKTKQTENIVGPKISLNIEIGSVYILLSPRQLHQIIKICSAFFEEDSSAVEFHLQKDLENPSIGSSRKSEPYQFGMLKEKIGKSGKMTGIVKKGNGNWCTEFDEDMDLKSVQSDRTVFDEENISVAGTSCTYTSTIPERLETSGEILNFNIQIATLNTFILHEDIIKNNDFKSSTVNDSSYLRFLEFAYDFFEDINDLAISTYLNNVNHLHIEISPLFINGNQFRSQNDLLSRAEIAATRLDFYEVLNNFKAPLIAFHRQETGFCQKRAELTINYKSSFTCFPKNHVCNTIDVQLDKCTLDLDISIYDRLSSLFENNPFETRKSYAVNTTSKTETIVSIELLEIYLRFPIVNSDLDKCKQNIRDDFLILAFTNFDFNITSHTFSISSHEINAYYCDGNNIKNLVHVLHSTALKTGPDDIYKYPKILFEMEQNLNANEKIRLPFSSKHVWRQSDTAHDFPNKSSVAEDSLLPGETEEINEFCEKSLASSKLKVIIQFPAADIMFETKQLYEILYNRLNSDLFMWEPSSSAATTLGKMSKHNSMDSFIMPPPSCEFPTNRTNKFKKLIEDCYIDERRNCIGEEESIYQSTSENILDVDSDSNFSKKLSNPNKNYESSCAIEICITKGSLKLYVPVRDFENHRILPGQSGKFNIQIEDLKVFIVTGFNNNNNMNYTCLQLSQIDISHCGLVPAYSKESPPTDADLEEFMESTFYTLQQKQPVDVKRKEALTTIIEVKKIPEQNIKRLRISAGVNHAILRHNPVISQHTWLNQLIDFFDIQDFAVEEEGYHPCGLITEIQFHFWDCAIDYRPKYLPFRIEFNVGYFSINSNLISSLSGCNLRFVAEDCNLYIAPFDCQDQIIRRSKLACLSISNLVSLLKIGLFDISVRLNDKKCPKIDLRCSIHGVHLQTCYDSGRALGQLISYFANNKDVMELIASSDKDDEKLRTIPDKLQKNDDHYQQQRVNKMMADALQDVVDVKIDARAQGETGMTTKGLEVFYFPDENSQCAAASVPSFKANIEKYSGNDMEDVCNILDFESNVMLNSCFAQKTDPQVQSDLGNIYVQNRNDSDSDDHDFYVIEKEKEKVPIEQIKTSGDPLRIVDNHFCLPQDKPDLLQSPSNFPIAEYRYTLCEMTFTWHLYGGNDFSEISTEKSTKTKKTNLRMSDTYKYGVSQTKGLSSEEDHNKINSASGSSTGRNLDVAVEIQFTKIRFSHEIYPLNSSQASRQVLLISDVEVRDRLRSSDINKFLYHPNTKSLPNKSDEHMLIIKALHVRPCPLQSLSEEECSLRISILPIKLNIDQDTLLFLEDFFSKLFSANAQKDSDTEKEISSFKESITVPVMNVADEDEVPLALQDLETRKMVTKNLDILINEECGDQDVNSSDTSPPIYFREVIFSPALPICFDYHGRRIELSRGPMTGLLMGLAQLQGSGICLRELINRRGLLGWNKLFSYLCKEWLKDIKRNQLPKILSGVGPTNAVLQLFQGLYDLFWLPFEQYQKDGRIIRGFQLGAQSFSARTALAALEITARIIHLLQFTAETTFDMLSTGPSVRKNRKYQNAKKRHNRPKDLREGVSNAYLIVKEGINDSAAKLIETAVTEHDQKGYTGAVGAVMRQIPQLVVCPAVLATQATTNILGGAKSSLLPDAKLEAREKWKEE